MQMDMKEFKNMSEVSINNLFIKAKSTDEFAYIFALLGINSGMEDIGWQPIHETQLLMRDIVSIINIPLNQYTQIRLMLLLYCQITESNYLYHVLYNMFLCIESKEPPKVFNFLDQFKNGSPPSVKSKVKQICAKSKKLGHIEISKILNLIFDSSLRNAISHADFILFEDELRLKHGSEVKKIKLSKVNNLIQNALIFFDTFFQILNNHKMAYRDGHIISNRKRKSGQCLADITLMADKKQGLYGFSCSDPFPLW